MQIKAFVLRETKQKFENFPIEVFIKSNVFGRWQIILQFFFFVSIICEDIYLHMATVLDTMV